MTKAEEYEAAWRLGDRSDFFLVDRIDDPDYKSFDYRTGIEAFRRQQGYHPYALCRYDHWAFPNYL